MPRRALVLLKLIFNIIPIALPVLFFGGCNISAIIADATSPTYRCQANSHVAGRIDFTGTVPPSLSAPIIVQYSTDNFTTVTTGQTITSNPQGLLSIAFDITPSVILACPLSDGTVYQIRAFQDTNGDGAWQAGEGTGRDDGTTTGDGTYIVRTVADQSLNVPSINIYLDTTSSQ